jgi:hypothetical protein
MTDVLIGLAGPARSGKDTAACILAERYGMAPMALATPIKHGLAAMLGVDLVACEQDKEAIIDWLGVSYRQLCQTLGTEWGRQHVASDLWLRVAGRTLDYRRVAHPGVGVVITDIRFDNEADLIRRRGGLVLHIRREQRDAVRAHASEAGLTAMSPDDLVVHNNGTLEEYANRLADAVDYHLARLAA